MTAKPGKEVELLEAVADPGEILGLILNARIQLTAVHGETLADEVLISQAWISLRQAERIARGAVTP